MSFYQSGTGVLVNGDPTKAFMADFSIIPNNTCALAKVKSFEIIEKDNQYAGMQKFIQITWEITSDAFKGRQVTQKIKCFSGTPEQIDRNLHMLMLIMNICGYAPSHNGEPTNQELMAMNGKILGIKIREWSMPKQDGSGQMEGNFVSECHNALGFNVEAGIKLESLNVNRIDSALTRNELSRGEFGINDEIPF